MMNVVILGAAKDRKMNDKTKPSLPPVDVFSGVFRSYPEIEAVYLFGSIAQGKAHSESDLDIAIVSCAPSLCERKLDILSDLARLGFCHVDLVFLDVHDIVLRFEAVRHNKVIYRRDRFNSNEYYSKTVRMYSDFLPYLRVQRQALKRRLTGDEPRNHS